MNTPANIPRIEDDQRHRPGPEALPLWNESLWFPMYDPALDVGIVFRCGEYAMREGGPSNFFLAIVEKGRIVHQLVDQHASAIPFEKTRIALDNGVEVLWDEPLRSFRLRYTHAQHGFDLTWRGMSAPYLYPHDPDVSHDFVPGHIEQGGTVEGTLKLAGVERPFRGYGHRDHTWGGERDWDRFHRWNYLSGEFDGFWFNAVRYAFDPEDDFAYIGCLFDGTSPVDLVDLSFEVDVVDGGTRPVGARIVLTDANGRVHRIESAGLHGLCPVRIEETWLFDHFATWKMGDRVGYGILEHGFREGTPLAPFLATSR